MQPDFPATACGSDEEFLTVFRTARRQQGPALRLIALTGKRNLNNGNDYRSNGQGTARDHRRRHDGLQEALTENDGDMEAAVDWLRKKGLAKAAKKAGRVAAEGLIGVVTAGTKGVIVEVNSETDFVARNELFQGLVNDRQGGAQGRRRRREDHGAKIGDVNVETAITEAIANIGENMKLRRTATSVGTACRRLRAQLGDRRPRQDRRHRRARIHGNSDELAALGKQIAMHIADTNPQALDAADLDPEVVTREKDIFAEQTPAGKPEDVVDKMVEAGVKTFFEEVTLLAQVFVIDRGETRVAGDVITNAEERPARRSS